MKKLLIACMLIASATAAYAQHRPHTYNPYVHQHRPVYNHYWRDAAAVAAGVIILNEITRPREVYVQSAPVYVQPEPVYIQPHATYIRPREVCSEWITQYNSNGTVTQSRTCTVQ